MRRSRSGEPPRSLRSVGDLEIRPRFPVRRVKSFSRSRVNAPCCERSTMSKITLNGSVRDAKAGERLIDVINRRRNRTARGLLPPAARPDPDVRHVHGRGGRRARAGLRDVVTRGMRSSTNSAAATPPSGRRSTAFSPTTCSIAPSATTTTATAPSTTRRKMLAVEHQKIPFQTEALRGRRHQPVLSLRSRPVPPLRALRRGVPERASQRDAVDQLGRRTSRACCGTAAQRSANRAASPAGIASRSVPATR